MAVKEFRVLIYCICGGEHAKHDTKNGNCTETGCECKSFRGRRIVPERLG